MSVEPVNKSLAQRILSFLNDELTDAECSEFTQRVKADARLANQVLILAQEETDLTEWAKSDLLMPSVSAHKLLQTPKRIAASRRTWTLAIPASLLISVGAALIWWSQLNPTAVSTVSLSDDAIAATGHDNDGQRKYTAVVVNESRGSEWYVENRVDSSNGRIRSGETLRLVRGRVDLAFDHGTIVTLQAPSVFEIMGSMQTRVHRGSLSVNVAKGAEGFIVLTPTAKVIDLGTKFGVAVDDLGKTDVAVFSGEVDVDTGGISTNGKAAHTQRLRTGDAVRLDERGTMSRIVFISQEHFPSIDSGSYEVSKPDRPMCLTEVWDNIERNDSLKFYEIVHGGMREDAKAYVDRVHHEWNGLDEQGMPPFLRGGDYVKPFNNDKVNHSLQLTLTIATPATVYVLLDDRIPVPAWLPDSFENTGLKIGLDEGPYASLDDVDKSHSQPTGGRSEKDSRYTAIGPGRSIDNSFSIWKKQLELPGVLQLGSLSNPGEVDSLEANVSMYGVVVVPKQALSLK